MPNQFAAVDGVSQISSGSMIRYPMDLLVFCSRKESRVASNPRESHTRGLRATLAELPLTGASQHGCHATDAWHKLSAEAHAGSTNSVSDRIKEPYLVRRPLGQPGLAW